MWPFHFLHWTLRSYIYLPIPTNPRDSEFIETSFLSNNLPLKSKMNTHADTPIKPEDDRTAYLSPDPDMQRGRKRRRKEELGAALNATRKQIPSGESATLRGRCRYRSTSVAAFSAFSSRSRSRSRARDGSFSPSNSKKRILRLVQLNGRRRRSQSPSRSRSTNRHRLSSCHDRRRRRQRTRSRSRDHCKDHRHHGVLMGPSSVELKSPLCSEMTVDGDDRREGTLEG